MNLNIFFDPRSVVVIGATPEKDRVGHALIKNILAGKRRRVVAVNPKFKKVLGVPCYPSVLAAPGIPELAIIAIRADAVPQVLQECATKGVNAAIVISAGFGETGEAGKKLEAALIDVAKAHHMALVGPNCLGVIDAHADFNASFTVEKPLAGGIAFVSQSGAIGTAMMDWALQEGVGFSKFVSIGNKAVLTENDFLEFLAHDKKTKAVLLYAEGISHGERFMRSLKNLSRVKPVAVLKAGRSARGAQAVASHTGALAPADTVFTAVVRQAGAYPVGSLRELFSLAKLFQMGITKPLRNLAIVTNGGGPSIVLTDLIDASDHLSIATLSEQGRKALKNVLPPMAATGNPVDVIGDALADRFDSALKIVAKEKDVDGIIGMVTPQTMTEFTKTASVFLRYGKKIPLIPMFMGGASPHEGINVLREHGIPNFPFPKDAVEALEALAGNVKKKAMARSVAPQDVVNVTGTLLDFPDAQKLLAEADISITGVFVRTKEDMIGAFKQLGGPVAVKIVSPDVSHKTDVGGVRVGVSSAEELVAACDAMARTVKDTVPTARVHGFVVQPIAKGIEVIIGMKRDPFFGPTVLAGLGGVFAEILQDVAVRVCPITRKDAENMLQEIKGHAILQGARGAKPVNIAALQELLVKISALAIAHPEITELDLNPVTATPEIATVIDARIVIA